MVCSWKKKLCNILCSNCRWKASQSTNLTKTCQLKKFFFFFFLPVNDINSRRQGLFWLVLFKRGHSSWFMLWTNPSVNSVPQNPNSQRSVAPGQQRVIYLMVNESLILCKRQVRVARAPADREIFAAWAFSQKVWAVPQSRRQGQGNNVWSVMALL